MPQTTSRARRRFSAGGRGGPSRSSSNGRHQRSRSSSSSDSSTSNFGATSTTQRKYHSYHSRSSSHDSIDSDDSFGRDTAPNKHWRTVQNKAELEKLNTEQLHELLVGLANETHYPISGVDNEKIIKILHTLSRIIDVDNASNVSKFCQFIVTLLMQQKISLDPDESDDLIRYLLNAIESNHRLKKVDAMRALGYVLYELPPKLPDDIYTRVVNVLLPMAKEENHDEDIRRLALTCLSNFCCRSGKNLKDHHEEIFGVFLENFTKYYKSIFEDAGVQKLMVASLRGLASVIMECKHIHSSVTASLIPKMKKLAFYGFLVEPANQSSSSSSKDSADIPFAAPSGKSLSYYSASDSESDIKGSNREEVMIRIRALHVIASMAKGDKRTILAEWQHLIPSFGCLEKNPDRCTLATSLLYDPSSKCRSAAAMAVSCLLENSSKFFIHAEDKLYSTPYMSYSQNLSSMLKELHTTLLTALEKEVCQHTKVNIIKAISALVANTPYSKLSIRMLSSIVQIIKNIIHFQSDRSLQAAAIECTTSIFGGASPLEEINHILEQDTKLITSLATVMADSKTPNFMRIETATALSNVAKNYHQFIKNDWANIHLKCIDSALNQDEPTLRNGVMYLLRSYTSHEDLPVSHWMDIIGILHQTSKDTFQSVRACTFFVYINMKSEVFATLSKEKRDLVLRHIDEGVNDKQASVRAAAFRALGSLVSCPILFNDPLFVRGWIRRLGSILRKTSEYLNVKIRACWVLANLGDVAGLTNWHAARPEIIAELAVHTLNACGQVDKIRCNAVRGLGNIAQWTNRETFQRELFYSRYYHTEKRSPNDAVITFEDAMITELLAGSKHKKKVKWNACYALGSLMNNPNFQKDITPIVNVLCNSVLYDDNFKVRTQSSYALLLQNREYTAEHYLSILQTLLTCYETSQSTNYKELKYLDKLKAQIRDTLTHMFFRTQFLQLPSVTDVLVSHHATVIKMLEERVNKDDIEVTQQFLEILKYIIELFRNIEMETSVCISYQMLDLYIRQQEQPFDTQYSY